MRKVIVLTSGGLDSLLTLMIMRQQGLEAIGLRFIGWFLLPKYKDFDTYPLQDKFMGFKILNLNITEEYTNVLLRPRYGYGSGTNPCIDCKLFFLKKAKSLMEEMRASFVATGEVVGQRPMSQRRDILRMLGKRSGLEGYLLRPLSARLFKPTIPEELGWVDRSSLFAISGRGRKRQMALAEAFGIKSYPSPAGGCILTEQEFKKRFSDLMDHSGEIHINDLLILKYGRHFRISESCKLVVGKNERENDYLEGINWGNVTIDVESIAGPFSRMEWDGSRAHLITALEIIARYCSKGLTEDALEFEVRYDGKVEIISYRDTPDVKKVENMVIR